MENKLDKYLNCKVEMNRLRRFAFLGVKADLDSKLKALTLMAEPEEWYIKGKIDSDSISIIFYYIVHTFEQCYKQEKVIVDANEDYAVFNTGLLNIQGDEIYGLFTRSRTYQPDNPASNYWHLQEFIKESDRKFISLAVKKPELATYFSDYNELYFDPNLDISLHYDHIYLDNNNRLPESLRMLPIETSKIVFDGFLNHTKKKIRRNNRIPVPQYYNDRIMFLIPVSVFNNETLVMAVERVENQYIVNTVLTMGMAYNCARLLTKPESNWLLAEISK